MKIHITLHVQKYDFYSKNKISNALMEADELVRNWEWHPFTRKRLHESDSNTSTCGTIVVSNKED